MEKFIEYINSLKRSDRSGYCLFLKACLFLTGMGQFGQDDVNWILEDYKTHDEDGYNELISSIVKDDPKKVLIDSMNLFKNLSDSKQTIKDLREVFFFTSSMVQEFGDILKGFNFGEVIPSIADPSWIMRTLSSSDLYAVSNNLASADKLKKKLGSRYADISAIIQMFVTVDDSLQFLNDLFTEVAGISKDQRKVFADTQLGLEELVMNLEAEDDVQVILVSKNVPPEVRELFKGHENITFIWIDPVSLDFEGILDRAEIAHEDLTKGYLDACNSYYTDEILKKGGTMMIVVKGWSANTNMDVIECGANGECIYIM